MSHLRFSFSDTIAGYVTGFDREQGRMDSRWGMTSHKLVLMICKRCGLVLQFSAGRGIFDFD